MASSSSSTSFQPWNHDVFLSFRGEDTRKTFVDHLYSALCQKGICTYKDDETLPRGESIAPALFKAIEGSRIAIIVFSENYADSSWCLEELEYIMKSKDDRGQLVMPIFYHVDPSYVRKQRGKYKEALDKYELENNNRVESWRKALVDAGNLSGWVPKDIANGHESKVIKEIVDTISNTLSSLVLNVNDDLVGIRTRLEDLKSEMEIGSDDVRMVGIWGVGGGGKTTLASSVYDEISSEFECHCFIKNIREESSNCGLERLQSKVLKHVLKLIQVEVDRIEEGRIMIKDRLCHKTVLMVLDDVDHLDQLNALAGSHDWFGRGSRIIITTRDKHLLNAHRVNVIYNICLLNDVEANQLFRKHASSDYITTEDYDLLSKDVISYAGGLPLALKVLGSFLCDKDSNEWMSALARLKDIPDEKIVEKLKISYDGLTMDEKELFLDIACFFRGDSEVEVMKILHACGFHAVIGVKVLIQKALMTIRDGKFNMHNLIQDMGHYIVRRDHPNNPERHSRVWDLEDVRKICSMNATFENDRIEAIDFIWHDIPYGFPQTIANMKKLRWIRCNHYPASSLPTIFQSMELGYLGLGGWWLKQLWKGYKYLPSLKVLNLSYSYNLTETPDLSGLPCLKEMILMECGRLKNIHPSVGYHKGLVLVDMTKCSMLEMFPPIIHMEKLEILIFDYCEQLCKFPDIQMNLDKLKHLHLYRSGIEVVPSTVGEYCTNLESLNLISCRRLKSIETNFHLLKHLKELHLSKPNLESPCESSILVELPDLPPSIASLDASYCNSPDIIRDSPTFKWSWNVSLWRKRDMERCRVDVENVDSCSRIMPLKIILLVLVSAMLTFISCRSRYSGCVCCEMETIWIFHMPSYSKDKNLWMTINEEMHNYQSDLRLLDETPDVDKMSGMFYISFNSLRHASWWNSNERPS